MEPIKITSDAHLFTMQTSFVDKFIKDANSSFIKVYIYLARHLGGGKELTLDIIADETGLLKTDVVKALKFWDKSGAISYKEGHIHLQKLECPCKEETDGEKVQIEPKKDEAKKEETKKSASSQNVMASSSYKASEVVKIVTSDEKLAHLFTIISQILNKALSSNDYRIIYSFIEYLKLPEQVIIVLFEYCVSISQTNMRYIEKIAYSWFDNGINTPKKAVEYVAKLNEQNSLVSCYKKNFKIRDRDLSDTETKFLMCWINELGADESLIMYAYDASVMNTGKISFKYMDAVIKSSLSQGTTKDNKNLSGNVRKSSFRNYPENNSIGKIEKEMIEKMMSKYGGDEDAINQ